MAVTFSSLILFSNPIRRSEIQVFDMAGRVKKVYGRRYETRLHPADGHGTELHGARVSVQRVPSRGYPADGLGVEGRGKEHFLQRRMPPSRHQPAGNNRGLGRPLSIRCVPDDPDRGGGPVLLRAVRRTVVRVELQVQFEHESAGRTRAS